MFLNKNFWKKVLITGHTGFKGGWLSVLLNLLNSNIYGYALSPEGKITFLIVKNKRSLKDFRKNIIDINSLKNCIKVSKPEIIFHLAAQSSVIESFKNPHKTVLTNVVGTLNLLEILKDNNM